MENFAQLDLVNLKLQGFARDTQETVGRVSECYFQKAGIFRWGAEQLSIQEFLDCSRAITGRIDEFNFVPKETSDGAVQQWIRSAAEDQGINSFGNQRREVTCNNSVGENVIQPAFLDQWHKQRTGTRGDVDLRIKRAQRPFISAAFDRGSCADYADVSVARHRNGHLCTRLNHADDRNRKRLLQLWQRQGRGSIAGDHDDLYVLIGQHVGHFQAVTLHCHRAFTAVRNPRCVAEVKYVFVRQQLVQRFDDCESANAGIKNANRTRITHAAGNVAA